MNPRTTARRATLALLTISLVSLAALGMVAALAQPAGADSDISIDLKYPTYGAKSQKIACTLTIQGGPAYNNGGNYTYKATVVADNDTGSSVSPSTATSQTGVFKFNVTLPGSGPQIIKLKINATSKDSVSKDSEYKVREFEVEVIDPIVITATVYNTGAVDADNVTARFYADDTLLGSQEFSVAAGSSTTLTYNWTWLNIADGKHIVTVTVDDPNGIAEFSDGNNVLSMTIYVGNQSNPIGGVLTVGVIIMSVLVALTYMAKPARRGKGT
jgi:hypothetical protein